jgi:hypothetical protein
VIQETTELISTECSFQAFKFCHSESRFLDGAEIGSVVPATVT